MKINITSKNLNPGDKTKDAIEKKLAKLDKYFAKDTEAQVVLTNEKNNRVKLEATIFADEFIFRAEERGTDLIFCLDKVVDKLASQMSRFKKKLIDRHTNKKELLIEEVPDIPEPVDELEIAKTKSFKVYPMDPEEAVTQMELLGHSFYVFKDKKTGNVCVAYKRNDDRYGVLKVE